MRSSTDNQTEVDEELIRNSNANEAQEMSHQNISDSNSSRQHLDLHLLQKLQVLQYMNPAIKALLNYKGIINLMTLKHYTPLLFISCHIEAKAWLGLTDFLFFRP